MPSEASLRVTVVLTAGQIARLVEPELRAMPPLSRARVMNRMLHEHPRVFSELLQRPWAPGESPFDRTR